MQRKFDKVGCNIYIYIILVAFVFLFTFIWFSSVHPLIVYDTDDWTYIGYVRRAVPLWKDWNPARVFPEVFMPLCGSIAAYLIYPVCGDYLYSITLVSAFALSVFVTLYVHAFYMMLRRVFNLDAPTDTFLSALFFIMHFLLFRSAESDNTYMLKCVDLTCEYFYIIPLLLNCTFVMRMIGDPDFGMRHRSATTRGMLYVALYLAIFSNLPASGILAVYSGSCLLVCFMKSIKHPKEFFDYLRRNGKMHISILALWLISAVYEVKGGRAGNMEYNNQLHSIDRTISALISVGHSINHDVLIVAACALVLVLVCALVRRNNKSDYGSVNTTDLLWNVEILAVSLVVMFFYTLLLCVAVSSEYAYRTDYLYGVAFFALILFSFAFSILVCRLPHLGALLPLLVFIFAFEINSTGNTFQENNISGRPYEICRDISRDILEQVIQADREGEKETVLYVPVHNADDNWPHTAFLESRLVGTLIEHGIISDWINITVYPDVQKNIEFGVPIPD